MLNSVCTLENHTFLHGPLVPGSVVIDAGANVGGFAAQMTKRFACRVYSLEPHPGYFAKIESGDRIFKFPFALAGSDGVRRFDFSIHPQGSRLRDDGETEVTVRGLESFAAEQGLSDIALVKLDIEGSEVEVLDSLSDQFLAGVGQFTIEFHDFAGYLTTKQVETAIERLTRRGFAAIRFSRTTYGDTLLINRDKLQVGAVHLAALQHVVKHVRGLGRFVNRITGRSY